MSPKSSTERDATTVAPGNVVCPHCSAEVKPGRKFCTQCGTSLHDTGLGSISLPSSDLPASREAPAAAPVAGVKLEEASLQESPAIKTGKPAGALAEPVGGAEEEESPKEAALRKLRERALIEPPEVEEPAHPRNRVLTGVLVGVMVVLAVVILLVLHWLARPTGPGQKVAAAAAPAAAPTLSPVTPASAATLPALPAQAPPAAGTEESSLNTGARASQNTPVRTAPPLRSAVTEAQPSAPARPATTRTASPPPQVGSAAPSAVTEARPSTPTQPATTRTASPPPQVGSAAPSAVTEARPSTPTQPAATGTASPSPQVGSTAPSAVTEARPSPPTQPPATPPANQPSKVNPAASSAEASAQTRAAPKELAQQITPPSPSAASLEQLPSPSVPAPGKLASGAASASPVTEPIRVGGQVQSGKLLYQSAPAYPSIAREAGIQGVVRLKVVIGRDGKVLKASPIAGNTLLSRAAVDAVLKWRYQPTELDGKPVEVTTEVDLTFKLP